MRSGGGNEEVAVSFTAMGGQKMLYFLYKWKLAVRRTKYFEH